MKYSTIKPLFTLALLAAIAMLFGACGTGATITVSPAQSAAVTKAVNVTEAVASAASTLVLAKAQSPEDLTNKKDLLDSAAAGVRTLEGKTNGVVTPALITSTVAAFTDPGVDHWTALAQAVSSAVGKSGTTDEALELAAVALNAASASAAAPTSP